MKHTLFFLSVLFCSVFVSAQNITPKNIINQSPEAAALGKFITIPVGYYTGIPETNVPVYTIVTKGGLTVPISLNYHGGGIKVEEVATAVGLGWAVNAGGAIIQQVNGLPDNRSLGFMGEGVAQNMMAFEQSSFSKRLQYAYELTDEQRIDAEPDIFYYSFNGESGKFFLDKDGKTIMTIPLSKLKISFDQANSVWQIVNAEGIKYTFSELEETETIPLGVKASTISSSWYLAEIISANGSERISFNYKTEYINYGTLNSETSFRHMGYMNAPSCELPSNSLVLNYTRSQNKSLSSINFPNGTIRFLKNSNEREDMSGSYSLNAIEVYSEKQVLIRRTELIQSYAGVEKRLYLDSLRTFNPLEVNKSEDYSFYYESKGGLPKRQSYGQDFWGYANGATDNRTLIPTLDLPHDAGTVTVPGADRRPNSFGLAGSLIKVKLPTGGTQEYDYEPNTAYNMFATYVPKKFLPGGGAIHGELDENGERKLQYEFSFTIPKDNTEIQYTLRNGPAQGQGAPGPVGYIYDTSGQRVLAIPYPVSNAKAKLQVEGTYKFKIEFSSGQDELIDRFHFGVQLLAPPGTIDTLNSFKNEVVGGFRLRSSKLTDPASDKIIYKKYTYLNTNDPQKSSGTLNARLNYVEQYVTTNGGCTVLKLSSNSNAPLTQTGGSVVGYSHITEYLGENGEFGKNDYFFTSPGTDPDKRWSKPTVITSREHHRGKLVEEQNYKFENGKYILMKKAVNTYENRDLRVGVGLKIAANQPDPTVFDVDGFDHIYSYYRYNYYDIETDRSLLSGKSVTTYVGNDSVIVHHKLNYNHTNFLVSREVKTKSNRDSTITLFRYPHDMVLKGDLTPYQDMIDLNIITPIIEEEQLIGAKPAYLIRNEYYKPSPDNFSLGRVLLKTAGGPLELRVKYTHDKKGNISTISKDGSLEKSYLWSYNSQLPIAEIRNASMSAIEAALGGRPLIDAFAASMPSDVQIRNFLLPLNQIQGAMLSSYTYEPLIGMTSVTDAKGLTTYYEYDGFQRLRTIKDQKGNIVKQYDYHYK